MPINDRNLKPGTKLAARYHKQSYACEVVEREGSKLSYRLEDGREFKSPSAAGMAITGKACNGWAFWKCGGSRNHGCSRTGSGGCPGCRSSGDCSCPCHQRKEANLPATQSEGRAGKQSPLVLPRVRQEFSGITRRDSRVMPPGTQGRLILPKNLKSTSKQAPPSGSLPRYPVKQTTKSPTSRGSIW